MTPDDPRHGTNQGYVLGCRQESCVRAHSRYQNLWRMGQTPHNTNAIGTARRIRALQAIGWSGRAIASRLQMDRKNLHRILAQRHVRTDTAQRIADLYESLCMTPGPSPRTRRWAQGQGFLPPLAWDDIDDPNETPELTRGYFPDPGLIDHAVISRFLGGEFKLPTTRAERLEIVRRWPGSGYDLERLTGWKLERYK